MRESERDSERQQRDNEQRVPGRRADDACGGARDSKALLLLQRSVLRDVQFM